MINTLLDLGIIIGKYYGHQYAQYIIVFNILGFCAISFWTKYEKYVAKLLIALNFGQLVFFSEFNLILHIKDLLESRNMPREKSFYLSVIFVTIYFSNYIIYYTSQITKWIYKISIFILLNEYMYIRILMQSPYVNYMFHIVLLGMVFVLYTNEKT